MCYCCNFLDPKITGWIDLNTNKIQSPVQLSTLVKYLRLHLISKIMQLQMQSPIETIAKSAIYWLTTALSNKIRYNQINIQVAYALVPAIAISKSLSVSHVSMMLSSILIEIFGFGLLHCSKINF